MTSEKKDGLVGRRASAIEIKRVDRAILVSDEHVGVGRLYLKATGYNLLEQKCPGLSSEFPGHTLRSTGGSEQLRDEVVGGHRGHPNQTRGVCP
jgi:hypothetical protein